jgi:hypothetical protein
MVRAISGQIAQPTAHAHSMLASLLCDRIARIRAAVGLGSTRSSTRCGVGHQDFATRSRGSSIFFALRSRWIALVAAVLPTAATDAR